MNACGGQWGSTEKQAMTTRRSRGQPVAESGKREERGSKCFSGLYLKHFDCQLRVSVLQYKCPRITNTPQIYK